MKPPKDLVAEILSENEWRASEFLKFKRNVNEVDNALWCRMCMPMIYAHWEGFVISALRSMLKYINSLSIPSKLLSTKIFVAGMGATYKTLSGKQGFDQVCVFHKEFKVQYENCAKLQEKIDTKSNLSSKVFKDVCNRFDFDFNLFSECMITIDRLVKLRNSIAHGEQSKVTDKESFERFIKDVNKSMDLLVQEIEIFLLEKKYLEVSGVSEISEISEVPEVIRIPKVSKASRAPIVLGVQSVSGDS